VPDLRNWPQDPGRWLPEFRIAIEAVGKALKGRQPTPDLLFSLRDEYVDVIPDHKVTIESRRKTSRKTGGHSLRISGRRLAAAWNLTNGQLRDAVNAVCPEFPIRLS
jgi:hypothetical protein